MKRIAIIGLAGILPLGLAACASVADDYPSLAKRDAERLSGTGSPIVAEPLSPPPPPPGTQFESRLSSLVSTARNAHQRFEARRTGVASMVASARGAARASESWIAAQVALSGLASARSDAMVALASLDQLYANERLDYADAVSPAARLAGDARDQVDLWVTEQDLVIDRLTRSLR